MTLQPPTRTEPPVVRRAAPSLAEAEARFTAWCRDELYTPEVIRATAIVNRYCDLGLEAVYRSLGLHARLQAPKTAAEVVADLGFVASADVTLRDMLRRLATRTGCVASDGAADPRYTAVRAPEDPTVELASLRAEASRLGTAYLAALDFLDLGIDKFAHALRDDPDFMDRLLSGRDDEFAILWHRATNEDPLQDLHGRMGAVAIDEIFGRGTILEVGGGTGNGIRHVLRHFSDKRALHRIEKYVFTDISTRFVLNTKHEMNAKYPDVNCAWKFYDLNRTFESQRFAPESVDLVYAVNAAHVAKDIVAFVKDCLSVLRPGGHIVFAERVRVNPFEMAPRELTLNLSIYHRHASERAPYRPMQCYLAPENWAEVFARAGAEVSTLMPDIAALAGHFPEQYAGVAVARKAR